MRCKQHPDEETELRCGKCEVPVCPKCYVIGPAGVRCRDCASLRSSPLYEVPTDKLAVGFVAGLAAASLAGYVLATAYRFGFFLLWGGFFSGYAIGEVVLRATGRKRGPRIEIMTALCTTVGAFAGLSAWFLVQGFRPTPDALLGFLVRNPANIASVAVAIFSAVSRVRFF